MKEKLKSICKDSTWSIAGIVLMNVVTQFVVYPMWNRKLGSEAYGEILFLVALTNIIANPMGISCNYVRIARSAERRTDNSGYLYILTFSSLLFVLATALFGFFGGVQMTPIDIFLYVLLMVVTVWLYYVDVEYRLTLHYVQYFFYCVVISVGYLAGTLLFSYSHIWTMPLLLGSLAGVLVVFCRGSIFKPEKRREDSERVQDIWKPIAAMYITTALSNLIFCADRIVLKYLVNSTAVTIYYLASMMGKTLSLITGPLSSVVIGYLAKYKGKLSFTWMNRLAAVCLALVPIITGTCTLASHIFISILYPQQYAACTHYFWIANLAQVIYCITNVITIVLLRFFSVKYQVYVNVAYTVVFCLVAIPMTYAGEITGFCWGMLWACIARMTAALFVGYKCTWKNTERGDGGK